MYATYPTPSIRASITPQRCRRVTMACLWATAFLLGMDGGWEMIVFGMPATVAAWELSKRLHAANVHDSLPELHPTPPATPSWQPAATVQLTNR